MPHAGIIFHAVCLEEAAIGDLAVLSPILALALCPAFPGLASTARLTRLLSLGFSFSSIDSARPSWH